ncbi:MAG TPA: EAL domain-containing protein [Acidimicrobiales bacterium]|nr:EAL domain-containing protein [Acidimicrobiales bacterium]
MPALTDWSGQQLAEFLAAVAHYTCEEDALAGAVELAAEATEAEVAAIVRGGRVVSSVGFPAGRVPEDELGRAAAGDTSALDVPGAGRCSVLGVVLDDEAGATLVLARSGGEFSAHEAALVRAMARVLSMTLRMLRTLDAERRSRERSERHAEENARLLASLQERQSLLERLFRIQRSISHRAPIRQVLDAICEGAAELMGDDVIELRVLDPEDQRMLVMVSSQGLDDDLAAAVCRIPVGHGVSGLAVTASRLVVTHDYAGLEKPLKPLVDKGLRAAMAAPVFQDGEAIGSLMVASYDPGRRYDAMEQEMLLAFAEHASLALNDASAVEALRRAFAEAVHLANHDTLTGLPNRALVLDRLEHALARTSRGNGSVGVLFVDLDRFKVVNDTLGHSIGDEVLIRIGERLLAAVRPGDTVGRLAGDEFVVVCEDVEDVHLLSIAERVAATIERPLSLYGRDAVITASIGVAQVSGDVRAEDLLRDADVAMYRAKERGRARIEVFDRTIRARLLERLETEQALRRAIQRDELRLHYQPIVSSADGRLLAVEALVRWEHPERGLVPPAEFIPVAEETGLILPIGRWVLKEACSQLGRWQQDDPSLCRLQMGVNLSARQFTDPDIVSDVAAALEHAGIAPGALSLEITESVLMEEAEATAETLRGLKDLGVCLSIDDFGTGYSSLSYLKRFPVDVLKIDRSFVDGLGVDPDDHAIVAAVVGLAHSLGLEVVGEGVETALQLDELRRLGCDAAQGYLIARPQPSPVLAARAS